MTDQRMQKINKWIQKVDKGRLEVQDKMTIASATVAMLEAIEPVYEKYTGDTEGKEERYRG